MRLIREGDTYLFYKYEVHGIYFIYPDGEYQLEKERLNNLLVSEDYVGNLYPIVKMDVALEQSVYDRIIKNKNDVMIKLDIRKYYRENAEQTKSFQSRHINTLFKLILDDDNDFLSEEVYKKEYPNGDTQQMNAVTINYELFLFKSDLIRTNRTMVNAILQNCTPSTAFMYLVNKLGAKRILISPVDNQAVYDYIRIPPLSLAGAFQYLNCYYGFHRTGSVMFFGFDRSYLIRYCALTGAFEEGEETTVSVIIPSVGSVLTDNVCSIRRYGEPNKHYVIGDTASFTPKNQDISTKILNAEEVNIVNNEDGSIDAGSGKNKITVFNTTENPFFGEVYNHLLKSTEVVISCTFRDCDASVLTPNKKYNFLFEDTKLTKKYKGSYCMVNKNALYVKDGTSLTVGVTCEFRKI